jgi:hypothetical protein
LVVGHEPLPFGDGIEEFLQPLIQLFRVIGNVPALVALSLQFIESLNEPIKH